MHPKGIKYFHGVPYRVSYRRVKYARLEFYSGVLHLILPYGRSAQEILNKKQNWIVKKYNFIQASKKSAQNLPLKDRTRNELRIIVQKFIKEAEDALSVRVNRFIIRRMKTKWGSCSNRGTITINSLARYLPDELIRYLVFHEVNHILFWKHDKGFWNNLKNTIGTEPSKYEELLTLYWFKISEVEGQGSNTSKSS